MNYIWEVMLQAQKSSIKEEELAFLPAEDPSPYIEVSFTDLNLSSIEQREVEVNPLYRFGDVFAAVFNRNIKEYGKARELFFDVILHYYVHMDLRSGLHRQELYFWFILKEMETGLYGQAGREAINLFTDREKRLIITALLDVYRSRNYIRIFMDLLRKLYGYSIVYAGKDRGNELYLYIGREETETEQKKVTFLLDTFQPVGYETKVFYLDHFGIPDVDETMLMDHILLI